MNKLWFKRKRYGFGWFPVTWQGWLVIVLYVVGIFVLVLAFKGMHSGRLLREFLVFIGIWTAVLIITCYETGERPKWQWGNHK